MFMDWLDYIRDQIAGKPYATTSSHWYNAKMRYVFNTTGPYSMNRFLKLPPNATTLKSVGFLECIYFKDADTSSNAQKRLYDVISYQSQSYFTKEQSIHVPVGRGDATLPWSTPTGRRLRWKTTPTGRRIRNDTTVPCLHDTEAISQGTCPLDTESEITSTIEAALESEITSTIEAAVDLMTNSTVDFVLGAMIAGVAGLIELHEDQCRRDQLRAHLRVYKNCTATRTALDHMPDELRQWQTTDLANIAIQHRPWPYARRSTVDEGGAV